MILPQANTLVFTGFAYQIENGKTQNPGEEPAPIRILGFQEPQSKLTLKFIFTEPEFEKLRGIVNEKHILPATSIPPLIRG